MCTSKIFGWSISSGAREKPRRMQGMKLLPTGAFADDDTQVKYRLYSSVLSTVKQQAIAGPTFQSLPLDAIKCIFEKLALSIKHNEHWGWCGTARLVSRTF